MDQKKNIKDLQRPNEMRIPKSRRSNLHHGLRKGVREEDDRNDGTFHPRGRHGVGYLVGADGDHDAA